MLVIHTPMLLFPESNGLALLIVSMKTQENISLKPYNTFGIDVKARFMVCITSISDLREIYSDQRFKGLNKLIIGGGSNILFRSDFPGLVLKNEIKGIEILQEEEDFVRVKVGAGEIWH